jgi:lambda family phage portal protein
MLDLDAYEDATLVRQKVAAMAAGAVVDLNGEQAGVTGNKDGFAEAEWGPGTLFRLDPGQDIRFFNPPETGDHSDFVKHKLRMVAVGCGATYELISGDYSEHNYSSLRASYVELRRRIRQIQHHVLVHRLLRPTWRRFVEHLTLSGALDPTDVSANRRAYGADWLPPRFEEADPQKAINAELSELAAGLKSRSQAARERGIAVEELDRAIAADLDRERALGIAPDSSPRPEENNDD